MGSPQKFKTLLVRSDVKAPPAGAFDPDPLPQPCGWGALLTLYVTQTQPLGFPLAATEIRVEVSPDGSETDTPRWYPMTISDGTLVPIAGVGVATSVDTWIPRLPARSTNWTFTTTLVRNARQFRVAVAEYGDTANPCNVEILAVLSAPL